MLEIILLFALGKKVAAIAKAKGREAWPWVVLFVSMWFGGEICGGISGAFLAMDLKVPKDNQFFLIWFAGICGAAVGACLAFVIIHSTPSLLVDRLSRDSAQGFLPSTKDDDDYQDPAWRQSRQDQGQTWSTDRYKVAGD
jgi:hypothetical protein